MSKLAIPVVLAGILAVGMNGLADEPFRFVPEELPAKTPAESRDCIHVRDEFQVELVAAEPDVVDPIAIDWGPDGKLWVLEMGGYPAGEDTGGPGGRVRVLEDTDGDGTYDRSSVFLQGLSFPTSLLVWREGVLITCAPDVIYAKDSDKDGRADERRVVLTGIVMGNPQHNVNGLTRGLDNWIHAANGDNGGMLRFPDSDWRVDIHARDFRFDPDQKLLETQSGMSQFSRCRDDWGNWFGGNNLRPLWHCVLDDHYLVRNRFLVPPSPCVDLADEKLGTRVFVLSREVPRFNEPWTFNLITAGCGAAIYRDELLGQAFKHSWFVCEPAHNLVHHEVLKARGVTFTSHRPPAESDSEFLASTDIWFRPVQARTGPDGALWIVDMYRLVIEHPDYIPAHWLDRLDLRAGSDRGRIYRVFPKATPPRKTESMTGLPTDELVRVLTEPNGPRRDLAQQLLADRNDSAALPALRDLVRQSERATGRLSALYVLDAMSSLETAVLCEAMEDAHAEVRRHAIRLSESRLVDDAKIQSAVLAVMEDPDPRVRMQLAYSLGQWNDRRAGQALAQLAGRDARDPFMEAAITSSAVYNAGVILESLLQQDQLHGGLTRLISNLLRQAHESGEEGVLLAGLDRVIDEHRALVETWQFEVIADFLEGADFQFSSFEELCEASSPRMEKTLRRLLRVFASARDVVGDADRDVDLRTHAARLLGRERDKLREDLSELGKLLTPQIAAPLQNAAIETLSRCNDRALPEVVLRDWPQMSPAVRSRVLDLLVSRKDWTTILLDSIAKGRPTAAEIGAVHRGKLLLHSSSEVRRRANQVLQVSRPASRREVIQRYLAAGEQADDMPRGRELFQQHCANCHVLEGKGVAVGPDLHTLTDYSTESLIVAVLDPNVALNPRYVEYSAFTIDGRIVSGIVTDETGNSITLIGPEGNKHVLLRSDLDDFSSTGHSLMPDGMEQLIPEPADLAALVHYVQEATKIQAAGKSEE